jgi:hypothetical protein
VAVRYLDAEEALAYELIHEISSPAPGGAAGHPGLPPWASDPEPAHTAGPPLCGSGHGWFTRLRNRVENAGP